MLRKGLSSLEGAKSQINWQMISEAVEYYKSIGYRYIDVPWIIPFEIDDLTKPSHIPAVLVDASPAPLGSWVMPGSGEQSFLWLMKEGKLDEGRYVTCTPCWRRETQYNDLTRQWFMKVELFSSIKDDNPAELCSDAACFMLPKMKAFLRPTSDGYDIDSIFGVELGSYGERSIDGIGRWVYGTGVAEPRFSIELQKYKESKAP